MILTEKDFIDFKSVLRFYEKYDFQSVLKEFKRKLPFGWFEHLLNVDEFEQVCLPRCSNVASLVMN